MTTKPNTLCGDVPIDKAEENTQSGGGEGAAYKESIFIYQVHVLAREDSLKKC